MEAENQNQQISPVPAQSDGQPSLSSANNKNRFTLPGLVLILILVIGIVAAIYFIFLRTGASPILTNSQKNNTSEIAKRTYFRNNSPSFVIEEKSTRNKDGSLETIVTSENKKLSHHLYFKDKIFALNNKVLTIQKYKSQAIPSTFLTTGENFLRIVKLNPNLEKTSININGKKTSVYTIGGNQARSFQFIKAAFAQNTDESLVKVYLDEDRQQLIKVEQLEPNSSQLLEAIEYQNGPTLSNIPQEIMEQPNPIYEQNEGGWLGEFEDQDLQPINQTQISLIEDELEEIYPQQEEIYPQDDTYEETPQALQIFRQLEEEAQAVNAIYIEAPTIPNQAIYLNPLSIIPTESGYNNKILEIFSSLFNQQNQVNKDLKEKAIFENTKFAHENIKIRIDGLEIQNLETDPNFNIFPQSMGRLTYEDPWTISFSSNFIPHLAPGYHTLEVFLIDKWYLAPNLMVSSQKSGEKILEIILNENDPPPYAFPLPNNLGYQLKFKGKNIIKPFQLSIGPVLIDDKNIEVKNENELIITLPLDTTLEVNGPAYDLTIIKDGQKVFFPRIIIISPLRTPENTTPPPDAKPIPFKTL